MKKIDSSFVSALFLAMMIATMSLTGVGGCSKGQKSGVEPTPGIQPPPSPSSCSSPCASNEQCIEVFGTRVTEGEVMRTPQCLSSGQCQFDCNLTGDAEACSNQFVQRFSTCENHICTRCPEKQCRPCTSTEDCEEAIPTDADEVVETVQCLASGRCQFDCSRSRGDETVEGCLGQAVEAGATCTGSLCTIAVCF